MKGKAVLWAVLAMSIALSVAYSLWQERATITANAQTGYIDLDFVNGSVIRKSRYVDVATRVEGSDRGNDGEPKLYLTISNLYPGANVTYRIYLKNDGTLPVTVKKCDFTSIQGSFETQRGRQVLRDVDFVQYQIQIDIDMFKIVPGAGQPAPPFGLEVGQQAIVWIYLRVQQGAPENVTVEAVFKCNYILEVKK